MLSLDFPGGSVVKNLPASVGDTGDSDSIWVGKIPWRRKWQPTPVFLPGESHGQRNLEGYNPCESDTTGQVSMHTCKCHHCYLTHPKCHAKASYFYFFWIFIYFRLFKPSNAALRLSLVLASRGYSCSLLVAGCHSGGFPCCKVWALGAQASVVGAPRLSCPASCGIFMDLGSNLREVTVILILLLLFCEKDNLQCYMN